MDGGDRKRRVRRMALMLVALVIAIYGAFVTFAMTRH
jgi:uncharacterized membrane protein YsdA (DUF1294 family)